MYGIQESAKGSNKSLRKKQGHELITDIIQTIDNSVPDTSVRDCTHLGKYCEDKCRLILVKLTQTNDVHSILASRAKLANTPGISIKPDVTLQQRKTEKIVLSERWKLIQNGTNRKDIKLRENSQNVQGNRHGSVKNSIYEANTPSCSETTNGSSQSNDSNSQ